MFIFLVVGQVAVANSVGLMQLDKALRTAAARGAEAEAVDRAISVSTDPVHSVHFPLIALKLA